MRVVCTLFVGIVWSCCTGLRHVRMVIVLRLGRRAWVRGVGILLVGTYARGRDAAGRWGDVPAGVPVLLAAHEEEDAEADKGETDEGSDDGAGDPGLAFALLLTSWGRGRGCRAPGGRGRGRGGSRHWYPGDGSSSWAPC
jgi:hypothetical protein